MQKIEGEYKVFEVADGAIYERKGAVEWDGTMLNR
jgi:hypothetical protein